MSIKQKLSLKIEKIKPYLPSKKFTKIITIGFVIVLIIILINNFSKIKNVFVNLYGEKQKITVGELVELDSDKDGIPDWEEALWGTDPHNAFSKETNVSDFVYINQRREAIKGEAIKNNQAGVSTENDKLNQTDSFARELFRTVIALEQSGNLNEQTIQSLADSFAYNLEEVKQQKVYTEKDIIIIENTDENRKKYILSLGDIFDSNSIKDDKTVTILTQALENEDKTIMPLILAEKEKYAGFRDDLSKIPVVKEATQIHLDVLNIFQYISENIDNMSDAIENPLPAIGSLNYYLINLEKMPVLLNRMGDYVLEKGQSLL